MAPGLSPGGAPSAHAATCPWMDTAKPADQRAHELVAAMSLDQKLSELYGRGDFTHYGAANYIPAIPSLCVPQMVFNDAGAGIGDGKLLVTAFPDGITQAASWDVDLQRKLGAALGFEAWHKGVNVQLAPGVDIARTPLNGRNFEYAGEDPYLAAQTGVAEIEGIQSQHVLATVKHYALNDQETNRMTDSSDADERTMQEIHLPAFEAAVKQAHVGSVMCSYNRVNGVYACENPYLLTTVLKGQFGFKGFVMSDWGGTHSTVPAALAGLDQEQAGGPATYFSSKLKAAVQAGQVPMSRIDDRATRIMQPMFAVGAFDDPIPSTAQDLQTTLADVHTAKEIAVARDAAEGGAVLLKNEGALPLHGTGKRIAVIGDAAGPVGSQSFYQGGGSSKVPITGTNPSVISPLQGITTRAQADGDLVTYAPAATAADAALVAKTADVAVVFVGDGETEGVDRTSLKPVDALCALACAPQVDADQDSVVAAVAAANPNTIVVLQVGGPVAMPWLNQVKGVLDMWYPGEQDGNAAAALLFGDVNPSGKLPFTFPTSIAQTPTPSAAQYPGVTKNGIPHSTYSEGLLVGYRWSDAKNLTPLFPFGFGLSYTSFAFSGLKVSTTTTGATATFTVRNTGVRDGGEVAQLYVADPPAAGEPPKQLKGYQKVTLAAGQAKQVTLSLDQRAFSHWDTTTHSWKVTTGCYAVLVGDSSRRLPLTAKVGRGGATCGAKGSTAGSRGSHGSSGSSASGGVTPPRGSLAATGLSTGVLASLSIALLGLGAVLARRRSKKV